MSNSLFFCPVLPKQSPFFMTKIVAEFGKVKMSYVIRVTKRGFNSLKSWSRKELKKYPSGAIRNEPPKATEGFFIYGNCA